VEEVSDCIPDATVHRHHGSCLPVALHRVQLSEGVCLVDRSTRRHVSLPVQRVLPTELPGKEAWQIEQDGKRHRQG